MLAEFLTVIPQTPSLVLISYRPEYRGALSRVPGAQTVALAPLSDSETAALVSQLLGPDASNSVLGQRIAERAAGNPFFAEEIVRELAERGVLEGKSGAYTSAADVSEVSVPATLQATIAACIDRLRPEAKRTLSAAVSPAALARFTPILVQVRATDPSWESAAARALRPFGFHMWQSLSLSMLRGMRVRPEGRIDREWAQSLLASRTPAPRRPAPDG